MLLELTYVNINETPLLHEKVFKHKFDKNNTFFTSLRIYKKSLMK